MSSEVYAAILGALLAGGFQTVVGICNRRREVEAIVTAIASEVDSICRLVRHQRYHEVAQEMAQSIHDKNWAGRILVIDIRQNYFTVFEGLVDKIGMLKPEYVAKIVQFYAVCRSTIDSTLPDGVHIGSDDKNSAAANIVSIEVLLKRLLSLGDEIVQLPKVPLHGVSAE